MTNHSDSPPPARGAAVLAQDLWTAECQPSLQAVLAELRQQKLAKLPTPKPARHWLAWAAAAVLAIAAALHFPGRSPQHPRPVLDTAGQPAPPPADIRFSTASIVKQSITFTSPPVGPPQPKATAQVSLFHTPTDLLATRLTDDSLLAAVNNSEQFGAICRDTQHKASLILTPRSTAH